MKGLSAIIVTMILLAVALFGRAPPTVPSLPVSQPTITPVQFNSGLLTLDDQLTRLYKNANPGVVSIRVSNPNGNTIGSGFVLDTAGYILTNYHVVAEDGDLEVAFPSGLKTRGKVIGADLEADIAVVKVDLSNEKLYPLALGNSDQLKVGQVVVALGAPYGYIGAMTMGIIVGTGRAWLPQQFFSDEHGLPIADFIQTDAAITPGNSGGPLLNMDGEVVGMILANLTTAGDRATAGLGMATSSNIIQRITPALIEKGQFIYPYIGITGIHELSLSDMEVLGLPQTDGIYLTRIADNSPAERAGLQAGARTTRLPGVPAGGDLIVAVDGVSMVNFYQLSVYLILNKNPGDSASLTIIREGKKMDIQVQLDKSPVASD